MKKIQWKKFLAKKWVFPAVYITAAALILTLMWMYQDPNDYPLTKEQLGLEDMTPYVTSSSLNDELLAEDFGEAIAVTKPLEKMIWPVENPDDIQVTMGFFDVNASEEEMQKAIVTFDNELWPHTGIDIVATNQETFSVVAALSGKIVRAEKDPVVGYVVDIAHEQGILTNYSSLNALQVTVGQDVKQGEIIGTAGRNMFEKDHGIHLHFEVRKDNQALNPDLFFNQEVNQVLLRLSEQQVITSEE